MRELRYNHIAMRLLATADLHYNHAKSRRLTEELARGMNAAGGDVLMLVGDTAAADGDWLEKCLSLFTHSGPKLFVAGNHELWTNGPDSYKLFTVDLPRRVESAGWVWLEQRNLRLGDVAFAGTVGWYDYSFASAVLGIPRRFYEARIAPGSAAQHAEYAHLFQRTDDISPHAREVFARWNDGRFAKLGRSDEQFLDELLVGLEKRLTELADVPKVVVGAHHLPFRQFVPPPRSTQWDFARAFLGSERIGRSLLKFPNIRHVICGHSHLPGQTTVGHIHAINVGSGYRAKSYVTLDL